MAQGALLIAVISLICFIPIQADECISDLENGVVQRKGPFIEFSCNKGYKLIGHEIRQCLRGRLRPSGTPECQAEKPTRAPNQPKPTPKPRLESCTLPDDPGLWIYDPSGVVEYSQVESIRSGGRISVLCKEGFKSEEGIESALLECSVQGKWDGDFPNCVKVVKPSSCFPCGTDTPVISNGHFGFRNLVLNQFEIFCDSGYELIGEKTIRCLPNGQWSKDFGSCEVPICDPLPLIENLRFSFVDNEQAFRIGSYMKIECSDGYVNRGKLYVRCQEDGTWDADGLICQKEEPTCLEPEPVDNGVILELEENKERIFRLDSTITYECDFGYKLIGVDTRTCLKSGWSGKAAECKEIFCTPPNTSIRGVSAKKFHPGERIVFKCNPGERIVGASPVVECMINGEWNSTFPKCRARKSCPHPKLTQHVIVRPIKINEKYLSGDEVIVSCDPGFGLGEENPRLTCSENGKWSHPFPTCKAIPPCGVLPKRPPALTESGIRNISSFDSKWPWMVTMLYHDSDNRKSFPICTGSLLNKTWALTAASCFKNLQSQTSLLLEIGMANVHISRVKSVSFKRTIPGDFIFHDLALIELETPAVYGPYVSPVCLPENTSLADYIPTTDNFEVGSGYVNTMKALEKSQYGTHKLQKLSVQIELQDECVADSGEDDVSANVFCATKEKGLPDACLADLGGPFLVSNDVPGVLPFWTQIGILVSAGSKCQTKSDRAFFQDIHGDVRWIRDIVRASEKLAELEATKDQGTKSGNSEEVDQPDPDADEEEESDQ